MTFVRFGLSLLISFAYLLPMQAQSLQQTSEIKQLAQEVLQTSFPELHAKTIRFNEFMSADSFFQSNFEPTSLWAEQTIYRVEYNPRLLDLDCPRAAVEAILAHELSHTLDYVEGGIPGILNILRQILHDPSNQRYEHRTDLRAIFRGYGEGLITYREWIYRQLNAVDLKHKQATYYQPAEIRLLMAVMELARRQDKLEALESYWLEHVPMSQAEIKQGLGSITTKKAPAK